MAIVGVGEFWRRLGSGDVVWDAWFAAKAGKAC